MWGEIEAPVKTQQSSRKNEDEDEAKQPEEAVTRSRQGQLTNPVDPRQTRTDIQVSSATWQHDAAPLATIWGLLPYCSSYRT